MGSIKNVLGNGEPWTINYGTGIANKPPFLYISVPTALARSAIRDVSNNLVIWADPSDLQGKYLRIGKKPLNQLRTIRDKILQQDPDAEIAFYPKLTHVGESHVTVAMGPELSALGSQEEILHKLRLAQVGGKPLFDQDGNGQTTEANIDRDSPYMVLRAGFYKDEADATGPLLVAMDVDCSLYYEARAALGMPKVFRLPNGGFWQQHFTVGYAPRKNLIHRSYVNQFGSTPRHRRG